MGKNHPRKKGKPASPFPAREASWGGFGFGWKIALLIVIATLAAYLPAMGAGFIWDDDDYVTANPHLGSAAGLARMWFKLGATPQYYPLVFTSFWVEHFLWGLHPLGYHLVNIILHAGSAILLMLIGARLGIRGAWLGGLIFALHPVGVESVAWITERKNVLSTFFYLSAWIPLARIYKLDRASLEPGPERGFAWGHYLLALGLFACAMLSKTVTCSLPVAVMIVAWWRHGRLKKRDAVMLAPFIVIGAVLGLTTAWIEKHFVGAQGVDWSLSLVDRALIAGRAIWFYLGKLIWPAHLAFIYPRWQPDSRCWWQYLFPLGAAALLLALWLMRARIGRGGFAAFLFFIVTLGPALGFIDVYPMRFSFVADHFQYLAMMGPIMLLAGWVGGLSLPRGVQVSLAVLLACVLGCLTWRESHEYKDLETLWRTNLAENPKSWLAMNNLGLLLENRGRTDEALDYYQRALQENPAWADSHLNLANVLLKKEQYGQAQVHYAEAYRLKPSEPAIPFNYGVFFLKLGRWQEAAEQFNTALALNADYADAHYNLGAALICLGRPEEAIGHYQRVIQLSGGSAQYLSALAVAQARAGHFPEAIPTARKALEQAIQSNDSALAEAIRTNLQLFQAHRFE